MVNFMCQRDWSMGCPGSWLNVISGGACERLTCVSLFFYFGYFIYLLLVFSIFDVIGFQHFKKNIIGV